MLTTASLGASAPSTTWEPVAAGTALHAGAMVPRRWSLLNWRQYHGRVGLVIVLATMSTAAVFYWATFLASQLTAIRHAGLSAVLCTIATVRAAVKSTNKRLTPKEVAAAAPAAAINAKLPHVWGLSRHEPGDDNRCYLMGPLIDEPDAPPPVGTPHNTLKRYWGTESRAL